LVFLKENRIKEAKRILAKSTSPASIALLKEIKAL
jgi:hypothetical protein